MKQYEMRVTTENLGTRTRIILETDKGMAGLIVKDADLSLLSIKSADKCWCGIPSRLVHRHTSDCHLVIVSMTRAELEVSRRNACIMEVPGATIGIRLPSSRRVAHSTFWDYDEEAAIWGDVSSSSIRYRNNKGK